MEKSRILFCSQNIPIDKKVLKTDAVHDTDLAACDLQDGEPGTVLCQ
jgi:hypothetical protein